MKRIGVISIGANSIKLMLSEVEDSGYFKIIDELKGTVRLACDLMNSSTISEEKIESALSTLKSFKSLCTLSGASQIITVITEDISAAENKEILKDRIIKELNITPRILTYDEEIYYIYLGIINSMYSETSLMVDIGGTSTHLAVIKGEELLERATIPIGCVNLSNKFSLHDIITYDNAESANEFVENILKEIPWLKKYEFHNIIGLGGSIRNLCKVDRRKKHYPLDLSHNYSMNDYDISDIYNLMKCKNLKQRAKIDGLSSDRADVILGAVTILNRITKYTNIEKITLCGRGLREGILNQYLNQNYPSSKEDILEFSIHGIMETLNMNVSHANNVYRLTKKLFTELKSLHKLGDNYQNIIKTSALLHDCGISIRYYDHHLHSMYIILNSHINGLSHKEILISGFAAAFHRNNNFHIPLVKFSGILNKLDVAATEKIGILLRIAEGLDRSLDGSVYDLNISIKEDTVEILLYSNNDLDLEIHQALRSKDKFSEIYQKELIIKKAEI